MNIKSRITQNTLEKIEKLTGSKLTLGKLIWSIRKKEELTQVDFASKLAVSKQHLCDIEHDRKWVSPKLAAVYADKLGYSKEQFIRLSLQDMVDRDGLNFMVQLTPKEHKKAKKESHSRTNSIKRERDTRERRAPKKNSKSRSKNRASVILPKYAA